MKAKIVTAMLIAMVTISAPVQQAYALDFIYPDDVYSMCVEICEPHDISPELVQAIIWRESRYAKDARNRNCQGLMQINEPCHIERMERLGVSDLNNPYENIRVGVDYLAELFEEYEEPGYVLDVYNGNSSAGDNYRHCRLSAYSKSILELAEELEKEHGK